MKTKFLNLSRREVIMIVLSFLFFTSVFKYWDEIKELIGSIL